MLADQIMARGVLPGPLEEDGSADGLRRVISSAQRFELSEHFAAAADHIVGTSSSPHADIAVEVEKYSDHARPPHEPCWLECVAAHRPRFVEVLPSPGNVMPKRVGLLLERAGTDPVYEATLVWSHEDGVMLSWGAVVFDFSGRASPDATGLGLVPIPTEDGLRARYPGLSPRDLARAAHLFRVAGNITISRWWAPTLARWTDLDKDNALADQLSSMVNNDWRGEVAYWTVALALINTRNFADTEERPAPERLNKHRRRAGKSELMDYVVCRVNRRFLGSSGGGRKGDAEAVRLHCVRGHFKARRTGLFWWSPHVRGDPEKGTVDKDHYEVMA